MCVLPTNCIPIPPQNPETERSQRLSLTKKRLVTRLPTERLLTLIGCVHNIGGAGSGGEIVAEGMVADHQTPVGLQFLMIPEYVGISIRTN